MVDYKSRFDKNRTEPDVLKTSTMKFNINDYVKTKHNQPIKKTLNKLLTTYPS